MALSLCEHVHDPACRGVCGRRVELQHRERETLRFRRLMFQDLLTMMGVIAVDLG